MRLEETMVEIELVTGKRGEPHIKSEHIGSFNNAIIGDGGKYVLDSGKKFSYEIVSNNLLRIYDGDAVNQGRHMLIKRGEYVDVPIENGTQSQKRSDIIVLKYKKNTSTGVETAGLDIIKGVPGDVPTDPEYLSTDILTSATEDDMPLYRVYLNGLNIESVEPLFDVLVPIKKMKDMQEEIEQLNSDLENKNFLKNATIGEETTLEEVFKQQKDNTVRFIMAQRAADNPFKDTITLCISMRIGAEWGTQFLFCGIDRKVRQVFNGVFLDWI